MNEWIGEMNIKFELWCVVWEEDGWLRYNKIRRHSVKKMQIQHFQRKSYLITTGQRYQIKSEKKVSKKGLDLIKYNNKYFWQTLKHKLSQFVFSEDFNSTIQKKVDETTTKKLSFLCAVLEFLGFYEIKLKNLETCFKLLIM